MPAIEIRPSNLVHALEEMMGLWWRLYGSRNDVTPEQGMEYIRLFDKAVFYMKENALGKTRDEDEKFNYYLRDAEVLIQLLRHCLNSPAQSKEKTFLSTMLMCIEDYWVYEGGNENNG